MSKHVSDSSEQRTAERLILEIVNRDLGLSLSLQPLRLEGAVSVELDGFDQNNRVLCEVYARIGALKGSQPDKVAGDMLKLLLVEAMLGGSWRKILCFADEEATRTLKGQSWLADVVRRFGFELKVIQLPSEVRTAIQAAQTRQLMINKNE